MKFEGRRVLQRALHGVNGVSRPVAWMVGAALIALGCSTATNMVTKVPAIADGGASHHGKVVWHDLVTHDLAATKKFYSETFGWTFEDVTSGYAVARHRGRLIAGVARIDSAKSGSQWIPQISVADVDARAAQLKKMGGQVLLGPFDLRGRGRVAVVRDPQSAVFGLIDASGGDPVDREAELNEWLWHEVWVDDPRAALTFYGDLLGYETAGQKLGDVDYTYFVAGDHPRAGVVAKPDPNIGAAWVSYLRVADAAAAAERAAQNGGVVLFAPNPDVRQGTLAIVADPGGAAFLLQQWPIG